MAVSLGICVYHFIYLNHEALASRLDKLLRKYDFKSVLETILERSLAVES
jgi:hypothetical protein